MSGLVIITHANVAFGLAMKHRLSADGHDCVVMPGVSALADSPRTERCVFLFDMLDDDAWHFVNSGIDDLFPNAEILPVNGSKFAAGDDRKIETYCRMIGLVERLSALSDDTIRL